MATRFYLPRWDGRAAPVSPAYSSAWEQTANALRALLPTTKGATAPTSTTSANFTKTGSTTDWDTVQMQFVSDTLDVAQSISGTFSGVVRLGETASAADLSMQVVVRVVSLDGTTERGVLYGGHAAALNATVGALGQELGTTAATRLIPAGTALSTVAAQPGDRIVVEVGMRSHVATTGNAGFFQAGDNSGTADFAFTAGLTTSLLPWFEFTQDLTFGVPQIALTPAAATWTAVSVTATPQPVTIDLAPAALTLTAVAVTAAPQPVTVPLTPATASWAGVPVVALPQPVNVPLTPAATAWLAVPVSAAPQPGLVDLTPAATTWTAWPVEPGPLPATVVLTPATTSWAGVPVTPRAPIVLRPNTGTVLRPASGTVIRPDTGVVARP